MCIIVYVCVRIMGISVWIKIRLSDLFFLRISNIFSSELLILSSLFVLLWVQIKFLFVLERWWGVLEEIQRLQMLKSNFVKTKTIFWNVKPEGFPSAAWAFCPCPASWPCPSTSRPACTPPQPDRGADEHFPPYF